MFCKDVEWMFYKLRKLFQNHMFIQQEIEQLLEVLQNDPELEPVTS